MKKNRVSVPILPVAIAGVLLATVLIVVIVKLVSKPPANDEIAAGIAYLESLEKKDPDEVTQVRKEIHKKKLEAQRDELIAQLSSGTLDPFSFFKDAAILGDSRAVGFWYYEFVDKGRVFADGGHTIRNIADHMDALVALNPATVYLCYGLNDISIGIWDTPQEYTAEYMKIIRTLQEKLPEATIVVSSIMPAQAPAFDRTEQWRHIPEWSEALGQACKENHILFANCDKVAQQHADLWDVDGIHFRRELYPYWSSHLVVTQLTEEIE